MLNPCFSIYSGCHPYIACLTFVVTDPNVVDGRRMDSHEYPTTKQQPRSGQNMIRNDALSFNMNSNFKKKK